jgi:pimeloyl-ACP methyl ester carboxylesterase
MVCVLLCLALFGASSGAGAPEFLPSIGETLRVDEWQFLGPFSAGYREGIVGAIPDPGYITPLGTAYPGLPVISATEYPSILAQGGLVRWRSVSPDSAGWVNIEFDDVYWDTIMDVYGYAGLVNKTFAYADIHAPGRRRALIVAERAGAFYLNGSEYMGGLYGHDFVRIPVVLEKGKNTLVMSLSGFGGHRFKFMAIPAPAPVMLLNDYTTPDLAVDETGRLWTGITVLNTMPERVAGAVLEVGDGNLVAAGEAPVGDLAPLCVKKVPVPIDVLRPPGAPGDVPEQVSIPVSVTYAGQTFADTMHVRVRRPGESFKRTFISRIDASCQYFAVLPPQDFHADSLYALILSLHGAGVRAEGQVDAYKPKSWAYVVAPTNRRPFGFDWQDWGRLDALEVLDMAKLMFPIDTTRVYLTGHSMGGHGVWHVGLTHPDLFAAIAPEAGWTSFELYIPWFLQRAYIFGDPRAVGMRDMALREDHPLEFVENALNLGVFIVHGAVDDNVPTLHGRMFASRLSELGYRFEYWEVPGRSHWWHDDSLDVSCVDYPRVMDFLRSHDLRRGPYSVRLKTVDLATSNRAYWAEIIAQDEPMRETEIRASILAGPRSGLERPRVTVTTRNVAGFSLDPPPDVLPFGPVEVLVDGASHLLRFDEGRPLVFSRRAGGFRPAPADGMGTAGRGATVKSAGLYGPIKQAYFSPFVLVYGTQGDRYGWPVTETLLHQARGEAFRWWRRGNGYVEVLPDTLVTEAMVQRYNLILFGGAAENSVTERMARELPVKVIPHAGGRRGGKSGGIQIGPHFIKGWGLAAEFIYPNPLNPERVVLVRMGTDMGGLRISDFFGTLHAGAGLPDYIIFDERVKKMGWAGVICTGFFDVNWQVDPGLMFLSPR